MAALNSKVQICNLANSSQGQQNSVNNIDTPKTPKELTYALWYDIARQYMLKTLKPNFCLDRTILGPTTVPTAYANSYGWAYAKPMNCLAVLGFNDIDTDDEHVTVEGPNIYTNVDYGNAPVLRYVKDIEDVSVMTPDFIFSFAMVLGKVTALANTQDSSKKADLLKEAFNEMMNSTAQQAQENKPIRKSRSRFREARYNMWPCNNRKA